ncbi:hypothetical protein ACIQ7D_30860 [Streptomyces sp. NPDC096310]|uniref:hypothetical protein n=1 Tax=Streptomyces sp. NPDC096310 TaxID=3366082 RepID=UPI003807162E
MIVTGVVLLLVAGWATWLTHRSGRPVPWEQSAATTGAWAFPAADDDRSDAGFQASEKATPDEKKSE